MKEKLFELYEEFFNLYHQRTSDMTLIRRRTKRLKEIKHQVEAIKDEGLNK